MARYRLRFLLQEFDLPRGTTILGRSSDCHVTIEDPLVSRHHARIVLDGDHAVVHDLNSRNGVKVNGQIVRQSQELRDGDRLRIGTQELVFCRVDEIRDGSSKTTGFLRHCARCRMPYPQEAGSCPSCGGTEALDDETLSGRFGPAAQQVWSVQLFLEVLARAMSLGRYDDAHRILQRATIQVEERLAHGDSVDGDALAKLAAEALNASLALRDPTWGLWVVQVYRRVMMMMPDDVIEKLGDLASTFPGDMAEPVERLVAHAESLAPTPERASSVAALQKIRSSIHPANPGDSQ